MMVYLEVFMTCSYYSVLFEKASITLMFVRFVCITILHLSMTEELSKYLSWMKFTINHPYRIGMYN
jgi:hypothetical protein